MIPKKYMLSNIHTLSISKNVKSSLEIPKLYIYENKIQDNQQRRPNCCALCTKVSNFGYGTASMLITLGARGQGSRKWPSKNNKAMTQGSIKEDYK